MLVCAKRIAGHGSLDGSGSGSNTDIIDTEIPAAAVNFPSGSCSFSASASSHDLPADAPDPDRLKDGRLEAEAEA